MYKLCLMMEILINISAYFGRCFANFALSVCLIIVSAAFVSSGDSYATEYKAGGLFHPMHLRWFDFGSLDGGFSLFPKRIFSISRYRRAFSISSPTVAFSVFLRLSEYLIKSDNLTIISCALEGLISVNELMELRLLNKK